MVIIISAAIILIAGGCSDVKTVMADEDYVIEDFKGDDGQWEFIADDVMGGKSTGEMEMITDDEGRKLHMSGKLSLENNGGFIQVRRPISTESKYFECFRL